jgi:hypothetical protein
LYVIVEIVSWMSFDCVSRLEFCGGMRRHTEAEEGAEKVTLWGQKGVPPSAAKAVPLSKT